MLNEFLEIGKIVGTHGIKGELRVDPWCDSPAFFCKFKTLYFKKGEEKLEVKSRPHKNIAIMYIKGIDSVEQADLLRGRVLYINRKDASLPKDSYFIQDILGAKVVDSETGEEYGKITDVLKTGANDVYQVTDENKKDYLVPVIDSVVLNVDVEAGIVTVKPMKGIFNDED